MRIIFVGVFYYGGPVRHLYQIFKIYSGLAKVFEAAGIDCWFFSKQNEILPANKTLTEEQFNYMLPEADLVFMWNGGLSPEKLIAAKCIDQGTPIYFMELGWLPQMNTFYFDPKGVNYASSITDWQFKGNTMSEEDTLFLNANLSYYHHIYAKSDLEVEENIVFVPFQVEADSQIINYSPHIKKMQELVDYMEHFIPGKVIFKKHPKDNVQNIIVPDRFVLTDKGTTHDYIKKCKYVVTINSTVGVEALTYFKPVINLGNAFYGGRGLTYAVNTEQEMFNAVKLCEIGSVAKGVIRSFLLYLFKKQWHINHLRDADKVMSLIYDLTK